LTFGHFDAQAERMATVGVKGVNHWFQVNADGLISFEGRINGSMYTPRPLPIRSATPFIAPYWADVDTRINNGRIYYRQATGTH